MKTLTAVLSLLILPLAVQTSFASRIERELFREPLAIKNAEGIVCTQNNYAIQFVESGPPIKRYAVTIWQDKQIILDHYEAIGSPLMRFGGGKADVYGFFFRDFRPMIGQSFSRNFALKEDSRFLITYGEKFAVEGIGAFVSSLDTFESDPVFGRYINGATCYIGK